MSDVSATDLQNEILGPIIFEEYRKKSIRKNKK